MMLSRSSVILCSAVCSLILGGPARAQAQTRLPFSSTFDNGTLSEWDGFRNTTGAVVMNSGCDAGQCLRTPIVAGTNSDTYGDFYFADHVGFGGTKVEEVWLAVSSKFDAGMAWPSGQKIAILNLTDGVSSQRRYQVILYVRGDGQYALQNSNIANWQFFNRYQNTGSPASVRFGQWDRLKMYVRLNTPGQSNGIVRLWVNGELKLQHTDVNIRYDTSIGMNKLILSTYADPSSPSNGYQWHDSITLSQTDPGGGGPTPPTAPTNVRIVP